MYEAHNDSFSGGGDGATWSRPGRGRDPWADVEIAIVSPDGWSLAELRAGISELERTFRQGAAAMALLVGAMPSDRDSAAELARGSGISGREARRRREVADVAKKMPEALKKLGSGEISAEHVAALAPVAGLNGAEKLLDGAGEQAPEKLARKVEQFKMSREDGWDTAKRQWARRSVRFFTTNDGMLGLTGLLPPVIGGELKMRLEAVMDARWRAEHPERAETLGGHGGEGREQRLADALFDLTGCTSHGNTWPTAKPDKRTATANGSGGSTSTTTTTDSRHRTGPGDFGASSSAGANASGPARSDGAGSARTDGSSSGLLCVTGVNSHGVSLRTEKPAVVITFNVDRWEAEMLGGGAIPITESLFDQTRFSLYYAFTNMHGEILKFGRARRDPTPLQKLAVMTRDRTCIYPDCFVPANRTDIHHLNEVAKDSGTTDVDTLGCLCPAHHQHVHINNLIIKKTRDGTIKIIDRSTGKTIASQQPRARSA